MRVDMIIIYDNRLIILNRERRMVMVGWLLHILGYTNLPTGHTLAHGMSLAYFHVLTSTTSQHEVFTMFVKMVTNLACQSKRLIVMIKHDNTMLIWTEDKLSHKIESK